MVWVEHSWGIQKLPARLYCQWPLDFFDRLEQVEWLVSLEFAACIKGQYLNFQMLQTVFIGGSFQRHGEVKDFSVNLIGSKICVLILWISHRFQC
jgi:hypothetical protein